MKAEPTYTPEQVFSNLTPFLLNPSGFLPAWEPCDYFFSAMAEYEILVVGAGGLGCQLVKNLALSGIRTIHLIDMDTIDLTNLNRQFLFRMADVNKYKAQVVSEFVMRRCPGVKVIPHRNRVQELDMQFYSKFGIIIGGLDNVEARKFLNSVVFQLNQNAESTVCVYIDGATEGFNGQVLVVEPYVTSCYQCSLFDGLAQAPKANYCTIAKTPRTPEHCIQYALQVQWEEERKDQIRDNDNIEHLQWIFKKAFERAKEFKIQGVTEELTLGVTKNVIPAIASTNALIASICTNQVLKILTGLAQRLDNYYFYKGGSSIGSDTYQYAKKQGCKTCLMRANKLPPLQLTVKASDLLSALIPQLVSHHPSIKKPFISHKGNIFLNPADEERYESRLEKSWSTLQGEGILGKQNPLILYVTDTSLSSDLKVEVKVE